MVMLFSVEHRAAISALLMCSTRMQSFLLCFIRTHTCGGAPACPTPRRLMDNVCACLRPSHSTDTLEHAEALQSAARRGRRIVILSELSIWRLAPFELP